MHTQHVNFTKPLHYIPTFCTMIYIYVRVIFKYLPNSNSSDNFNNDLQLKSTFHRNPLNGVDIKCSDIQTSGHLLVLISSKGPFNITEANQMNPVCLLTSTCQ